MALASLRRIGAPISLLSKHHIFRPTSSASAAASNSAKVSDRIVRLFAIDLDGSKREVVGLTGQTLHRALANAGLIDPASHRLEEIDACSAECEVHIAQEWLEKMPEPSYEERYCSFVINVKTPEKVRLLIGCEITVECVTLENHVSFRTFWIRAISAGVLDAQQCWYCMAFKVLVPIKASMIQLVSCGLLGPCDLQLLY